MVKNLSVLTGTSNVHLAMVNNLTPIGTHAHEFFMFHAAKYGFKMATQMALDGWICIYNGDLGIALPDTFTTDVFLRSFNTKYAKLFDGVRQDSGNPVEFTTKIVKHYQHLKINPLHKVIVFSDGINSLNILRDIKQACEGLILPRAGIGTWITNEIPNLKPLNMVIKMSGVYLDGQWVPTVKLSDNKTKHTGDPKMVSLCKQLLNISE
jgi:nicotinate phosphoribosyltransferase